MPTKDVKGPDAGSSNKRGRISGSSPKQPNKSASRQSAKGQKQQSASKSATPDRSTGTPNPPTGTPTLSSPPAETGPHGYPLLSLTKLAAHCDIDRSVARVRLQRAKIKPVEDKDKKRIFELTPEVEELLNESGDPRLDDLKYRELEAKARLKEMEVDRKSGRLVDFDEACETLTKIIKGLHDRLTIDYPSKAGLRLHKLKTGREVSMALKRDFDKIFGEFRADFRRFLK